jgi:glucose-6-phosphate 1-epimerase
MNTLKTQTFGGQLLQASLLGTDIFYCPATIAPPPTPTRGGVPVLFPQFASLGDLRKHGYARTQEWQVFSMLEGCVSSSLLLTEQPDWPHRAQLNIDASVEDDRMEIHFEVRNVGNSTFEWTGGLHPYFLVGDVLESRIEGLLEEPIFKLSEQGINACGVRQAHAVDEAHIITPSLKLFSPNVNLLIEQSGFDAWQLWNPSAEHNLSDIPHADWQKFLCVEPVVLMPKTLAPKDEWFGCMTISLLNREL